MTDERHDDEPPSGRPDADERRRRWEEIQADLEAISRQGEQGVDLAAFVERDREQHDADTR